MPADIKAAPTGEDSVLLVWRPPLHSNGILTKYTILMKDMADREVKLRTTAYTLVCCYNIMIHLVCKLRIRKFEKYISYKIYSKEF